MHIVLHAQQAACTCLFEIWSSVGLLPAMAHRHAATLLLKKAVPYKLCGVSHSHHRSVTSCDYSFMVVEYHDVSAINCLSSAT